jgi:transcription termination/antitermination protein NusG
VYDIEHTELAAEQPLTEMPPVDDAQMGDPAGAVVEQPAFEAAIVEEPVLDGPVDGPVIEAVDSDEPATGELAADAEQGELADAAAKPKDNRNWFVVHTYSGYENKVKANLERRIHSMGMQDKIFRVLVPMEDEVEFKDGKRKITPKKVFPGYVLVEMIMDDQSWYVVRNTQGVTGFVGSPGPGEKPVPLQDKEVKTILKQMGIEAPKLKIDFKKGDRVKVTSGPFFDFTGVVDEIAPEKERLRALISIFGRETPVELEFFQVEKV